MSADNGIACSALLSVFQEVKERKGTNKHQVVMPRREQTKQEFWRVYNVKALPKETDIFLHCWGRNTKGTLILINT